VAASFLRPWAFVCGRVCASSCCVCAVGVRVCVCILFAIWEESGVCERRRGRRREEEEERRERRGSRQHPLCLRRLSSIPTLNTRTHARSRRAHTAHSSLCSFFRKEQTKLAPSRTNRSRGWCRALSPAAVANAKRNVPIIASTPLPN
jgi:hypothetical protein